MRAAKEDARTLPAEIHEEVGQRGLISDVTPSNLGDPMKRSPPARISTRRTPPRLSKAKLAEMIEEATVDAYGESERATGWFTMIEQHLALPFETKGSRRHGHRR